MIHKYRMNDMNIVIDVNSGSVHVVDNAVYDILDYYKTENKEKIFDTLNDKYNLDILEEAYLEIQELANSNMLFSEDIYSEVVSSINNRNPVVKALCLHIAHDCNLKCKYCFAEEGEYHGERSLMSIEVGKAAIDFLIENSGNRRNLEIDFFGGEPLMNFDVVKEIVSYARSVEIEKSKNFRFTITTNGILLNDEIQDYINNNMYNVVLSIDGRKEINDKMRPKSGGQGSYDTILPKFMKMSESRNQENYYVRGTFTRNNLDFSNDIIHLADLGFKQISIEPVVADDSEDYAIKKDDLEYLFGEYEKLANIMIERKKEDKDFNFFHFMIDLSGGPCVSKRMVGCGSGTEYLAVDPKGLLYPCHQFVGKDEYKVGNVFDGVNNPSVREKFENLNVYTKEGCQNCWAKFYCSGGCAANSMNAHNDLTTPYEVGCELQKKRVECAIMLKAWESFASEGSEIDENFD